MEVIILSASFWIPSGSLTGRMGLSDKLRDVLIACKGDMQSIRADRVYKIAIFLDAVN